MIEAFWDFYIKRLGYIWIAINSASAMYISFLGDTTETLQNHTAYIILYCSSYRIRTGDLRDENQLTFKHETNNKMKRAALPLS